MSGVAIITEACISEKDRSCVDVCPVQCIYELDTGQNAMFSEDEAGSGQVANTHPAGEGVAVFGDQLLYVHLDECTSCGACYEPGVCPVGAIYAEDDLPNGGPGSKYNPDDPHTGHDHSFFLELSRTAFAA